MAEALLKQAFPNRNVHSAGLGALIGHPADPISIQLMHDAGIDITSHIARQISSVHVAQADIILVMDHDQRRFIEARFPAARGKVFRLGEDDKVDIPDPYKEGIDSFQHSLKLVRNGVFSWTEKIKKMG